VADDVRVTGLLRPASSQGTFNLNPGLCQPQRSFGWRYGDKDVWRLDGTNWLKCTPVSRSPTIP